MKKTLAAVLCAVVVLSCCGAILASADTATNLAKNCAYTGTDFVDGTPDSVTRYSAKLTDGVKADAISYDDQWYAFWYNTGSDNQYLAYTNAPDGVGTIVIDLGKACTVDSVNVNLFVGNASGILAPKSVTIAVSADNKTFTDVASKTWEVAAAGDETVEDAAFDAKKAAARYVRVTIELNGTFAFLNEIEVIGTEAAEDSSSEASSDETTSDSASSDETSSADEVAAYIASIEEKLGEAVADSAMNVTLSNVVAEDGTITVTLTIDGLKDGAQVDVLEGALCYDAEKLTLTTNLEDLVLTTSPDSDWETLTAPAGEGKLDFSAFTTKAKTLLNKDGKLTMDLTFTLKDGCTYGAVWMENGVSGEETDLETGAAKNTYKANGGYTVINTTPVVEPSEDSSSATSSTTPKPGDAGIVVFALLGLVAVAGAAVVIKVRH